MSRKVYLGDSVYAEFDSVIIGDVTLTTENGYDATNTIYLEPQVIDSMIEMRERTAWRAIHLRALGREGEIVNAESEKGEQG